MIRYKLSKDNYNNWYMLPEQEWDTWDRLLNRTDRHDYDAFDRMEKYIIDIDELTFEKPNL